MDHLRAKQVDCEYLLENQSCKSITESPEGKVVRKDFCSNDSKDHCCYLCSKREDCEVSCTYLERSTPEIGDESSSESSNLEIDKCDRDIEKLSVLLANGKIGEQSYLAAVKTLNRKKRALRKAENSGRPQTKGTFRDHGVNESTSHQQFGTWFPSFSPCLVAS